MNIKIDKYDIVLSNYDFGVGAITIIDECGQNWTYRWNAMNMSIEQFLQNIDSEYFAKNLLEVSVHYSINWRKTFRNIREHIRDEIGLKWYQHTEFQKHLRQNLNDFYQKCLDNNNEHYFVNFFHKYVGNFLHYHLIEDYYDRENLEKEFENIQECWYFMQKEHSLRFKNFMKLHKKLAKVLSKFKTINNEIL